MKKPKVTMTSREAAALLVSGGLTDDVDKANAMAEGSLLDPDALTRAHFRRLMGFDFTVNMDSDTKKAIIVDNEKGYITTALYLDGDDEGNARRITKACLKLKKLHDKPDVPEGELA